MERTAVIEIPREVLHATRMTPDLLTYVLKV